MKPAALLVVTVVLALSSSALACPETDCKGGRLEMQREFVVVVTHEGTPLPGAIVEVTTEEKGETSSAFSGETAADGSVKVNVTPGDYWITTSYLGHEAVQCIRVAAKPGKEAKREFTYEWGVGAPATKQVAGKLVDAQTGEGVAGARLKLRSPDRRALTTVSGAAGSFAFENTPPGTYVLHTDPGTTRAGKRYTESDFVIVVSPEAKANALTVKRREAPNGNCRNAPTDLELRAE